MEEQTLHDAQSNLGSASNALKAAQNNVEELIRQHAEGVAAAGHAVTGVDPFVFHLAIFALAIFVGYYVVWSVTPALHTPLMSVTNAISSVIIVGAILAVGISASGVASVFGFVALVLASVNIFGGFLVTQRMLAMYRKKGS